MWYQQRFETDRSTQLFSTQRLTLGMFANGQASRLSYACRTELLVLFFSNHHKAAAPTIHASGCQFCFSKLNRLRINGHPGFHVQSLPIVFTCLSTMSWHPENFPLFTERKNRTDCITVKMFLIIDILPEKDPSPRAFIAVFRLLCLSHLVVIEKKSVRAQF